MKAIIHLKVTVPFNSYNNIKLDNKAFNHIKRWIKSSVENGNDFIPLYVQKDSFGSDIEDSSQQTKIKIVKAKLKK